MQHVVHKQIRVLKSLIKKYTTLGEFDYVQRETAEDQLKELEVMQKEWEKEAREECRRGPEPVPTTAPTADSEEYKACCKAFDQCIAAKKPAAECKKDRTICEENIIVTPGPFRYRKAPTPGPRPAPTMPPTPAPTTYSPTDLPTTISPTTAAPTVLRTLKGFVKNAVDGRGIRGAVVKFTAGPNAGKQATTASDGSYHVVLGAGGGLETVTVTGLSSFEDSTETMRMTKSLTRYDVDLSPKLNKGEFRVIFSWGATPRDMDIWMSTPDPSCTVGFRQKTCKSQYHHVGLDKDDTSGYGPETITIHKQIPGLYKFYVHRYSSSGDLRTSGGIVKVFHKLYKSPFTVFQKTFKIGVDGQIVAGARYPKPNKRDSSYAPLPLWTNATSDCRPYTPRSGNACVQDSIWSVFAYNSTSHRFATAPNLPSS
jgi:hypothetical protein